MSWCYMASLSDGRNLKASLMQVIRSFMILELDVVSLSDLLPCSYINCDVQCQWNKTIAHTLLHFDVSLLHSNMLI